jgi:cyclopropane-fatty-acyl-phospholipid synthase
VTAAREGTPPVPAGRLADRLGLALLLSRAGRLRRGSLDLRLPDGSARRLHGRAAGPHARLMLHRGRAVRRCLAGGGVGLAEGYIAGEWDTPDLVALLELLDLNREAWGRVPLGTAPRRWRHRLRHLLRASTKAGSRRNIPAHYDLGNAFFAAWLDPSLTYSAAMWSPGTPDLAAAQAAKHRRLARLIGLRPGHRLLEIGCGWGTFAILAAKEFGAEVRAITLSLAQAEHARAAVFRAGLAERVEILLQDYREVQGQFDRIAAIEVVEAVGERFWPVFFTGLRRHLLPQGRAGLQAITIAEHRFPAYRRGADFIQTHIFPGGMLPSPGVLAREIGRAGLVREAELTFGGDYARTLAAWNARFQAAWPGLRGSPGFDERFRRLWTYYLAYCEAGFRTGTLDVRQTVLRPI